MHDRLYVLYRLSAQGTVNSTRPMTVEPPRFVGPTGLAKQKILAIIVRDMGPFNGTKRFVRDLQGSDNRFTAYELKNPERFRRGLVSRIYRLTLEPIANLVAIRRIRADGFLAASPFEGTLALALRKHPLGVLCFDMSEWSTQTTQPFKRRLWRLWWRVNGLVAYRQADVVFCPTDFVRNSFQMKIGRTSPSVLLEPRLSESFIESCRLSRSLTTRVERTLPRALVFVMVSGDLSPEKCITHVIEGISWFLKTANFHSTILKIVGRGSDAEKEQLKARAAAGGINLEFLDGPNDSDLIDLYVGADSLIETSIFDWFNYPPLEALACGTPVVYATPLSNVGIFEGVVAKCSLDRDSIAKAIAQVVSPDADFQRRTAAGTDMVCKSTMQDVANEIYRNYFNAKGNEQQG